jgi:hypothetical protein
LLHFIGHDGSGSNYDNWLTQVSKENRNAGKILVEKDIRNLLLLEGLVKQKLSFVFKGGTALMLYSKSSKS